MHSDVQLHQRRRGIVLAILLLYALIFCFLYPRFREGSAAFTVLAVATIAWTGGARTGALAGLASFPLNMILLNLVAARTNA